MMFRTKLGTFFRPLTTYTKRHTRSHWTWKKVTSEPEAVGRSSHSLSCFQNKLYLFGGENQPRKPLDSQIHVFDLSTSKWSKPNQKGQVPPLRVAHTAQLLRNKLYLFGGRTEEPIELNDLYSYDVENSTWSRVETQRSPEPRSYHASTSLGDDYFIFGGCKQGGGRWNDLWRFDSKTLIWEPLPNFGSPSPRGGASLIGSNGKIFLFFGFDGKELDDVFVYDLEKKVWRKEISRGELPSPRSVFGACAIGQNKIFVYGGEVQPADPKLGHLGAGRYSNEAFLFDSESLVWEKLDLVGAPSARGWFACCTIPNGVAVHGGYGGDSRLGDLYLLTEDK
eukprot:TRINITY_DN339_c0_g1_i1.p1 TRINITY_DN339_c0_g1~~TRINITY_DN339_c0_g1_i1.p1  ORF type:complete len:337 (+),score=40.51 TRINITY_DN339_c0_g1_i1:139-1149(+)